MQHAHAAVMILPIADLIPRGGDLLAIDVHEQNLGAGSLGKDADHFIASNR